MAQERDWVLICGHVGPLPIQLIADKEEAQTIQELFDQGVGIPEEAMSTPREPVCHIALCYECGRTSALSTIKLMYRPVIRRLKELRDDGAYFKGLERN